MKYFYINDNKFKYTVTKKSILDFCDNIKLNVPYFCYHNKLSLAGNCRMCLVEIKNSLKPIVSCTMLITNKMKIYTHSLLVKKARENILEFLLLNHPLDCPICDQGGECDLQDQSFLFGNYKKRFYNFKRIVIDKNISPIIKMLMTRCIHCTRCVRFSYEISGDNSNLLGVFQRGVNSEIGTYVSKTFNSELSGNLIDICPVGALTFKQYSFINRNWELKNIKSIDFTDGFGLDTQIFISNNHLIKIQPSFNSTWITDKTRFSFDGMFSKERLTNKLLLNKNNSSAYWQTIFQNIIEILYFKDHLNKHSLFFNLIIILNNQLDMETLNILSLINKKYIFIKLKKLEKITFSNDHEESFLLNSNKKELCFNKSQFCLLLNSNLRFEGYSLNLKLRQNVLKNNLKVVSLSSITNLTFPVLYLGSTINTLNNIIEGNSIINQNLIYSINPYIIHNSDIFKRKDNYNLIELYNVFKKNNFNIYNFNWNGLNTLSNTLSDSGFNLYSNIKTFNFNDYHNSNILHLINIKFNFLNKYLKKYLELKLLNFTNELNFLLLLEQNFIINSTYKNVRLLNFNFFENSNNIFFNTQGLFKKTPKIIVSNLLNTKSDKNILKILDLYLNKLVFVSNLQDYSILNLNYLKFSFYNMDLNLLPSTFVSSLNYKYFKNSICLFYFKNSKFKLKKKKFFVNKLLFWLEDYYLNNKDLYSYYSLIMLECSKSFRKHSNNFLY
nr:NADH dehydrogenase subunit 11 [Actinocyclus sp. mgcode 4]